MKIIVTTIFRTLNFGAVLQAYALHSKLISMGHDCKILNYRPVEIERRFNHILTFPSSFKQLFYNILLIVRYRKSREMIRSSNEFLNKYLRLSDSYITYLDILNNPPVGNVFLCGSDQIWNPRLSINKGISPIYFLKFVKDSNAIKASYAASVGENFLDEKYKNEIKDNLKSFDFISVREEKAKEILSFVNREIDVIADPVFLLNKNQWLNIAKFKEFGRKYILCYFLYHPKFLNSLLKKIKKETGYSIIIVSNDPYTKIFGSTHLNNIGPDVFLGLIANAEIILTSSFHGTALSILFNKQFYSVVPPNRGSRILNILEKTGLQDRIIENEITFRNDLSINYVEVEKKVEKLRSESIDYLNKIIKAAETKQDL